MIYLIGGTPRSGKTLLGKEIAQRKNIRLISSDDLEIEVFKKMSEEEQILEFPKRNMRIETGRSNDTLYEKYSPSEIRDAYIAQSKVVWTETIKLIENYKDLVIEGYHLHPEFVEMISKQYIGRIRAVFLIRRDIETIVRDAQNFGKEDDWFTKQTKNEETYPKIAKMISLYGDFIYQETSKHNQKVFNMDINFQDNLNKAKDFLLS